MAYPYTEAQVEGLVWIAYGFGERNTIVDESIEQLI